MWWTATISSLVLLLLPPCLAEAQQPFAPPSWAKKPVVVVSFDLHPYFLHVVDKQIGLDMKGSWVLRLYSEGQIWPYGKGFQKVDGLVWATPADAKAWVIQNIPIQAPYTKWIWSPCGTVGGQVR